MKTVPWFIQVELDSIYHQAVHVSMSKGKIESGSQFKIVQSKGRQKTKEKKITWLSTQVMVHGI